MTKHWELIQTVDQLNDALYLTDSEKIALVIDTETNGLHPYRGDHIIGVSWYLPTHDRSYYLPVRHEHDTDDSWNVSFQNDVSGETVLDFDAPLQALINVFNRKQDIPHIFFNALFDLHMLCKEGYNPPEAVEDVMIAAHLAYENERDFGRRYQLKYLAGRYLSTDDYDPVAGEKELEAHAKALGVDPKKEMYKMPPSAVAYYAAMDVILTWQLRDHYLPALEQWGQTRLYNNRNTFLRKVLLPMEQSGFPTDVQLAQELTDKYTPMMDAIQDQYSPLNLASPAQLKVYLRNNGIIKGNRTDKVALVEASLNGSVVADDILEFRRYQKQLGFYKAIIEKTDDDGSLRTSYFPIGTNTGRMSARDPNLQQIPRKSKQYEVYIKKCFVVPHGWVLVQVDYSQLELRLATHYAEQSLMIERYLNGIDQHQATADLLTHELGFEFERAVGKAANFGLLYGMGAKKARQQWSKEGIILDLATARQIVTAWNELYPEFYRARWTTQKLAQVPRPRPDGSGEYFRYLQLPYNGRTRKFHEYKWWTDLGLMDGWRFDYETSKAWNSLIQGTGAAICEDGILRVMLHYDKADWFVPLYTVHDSFGFMVPEQRVNEVIPNVVRLMSDDTNFVIPLPVEAEVSMTSWYDLEEYTA